MADFDLRLKRGDTEVIKLYLDFAVSGTLRTGSKLVSYTATADIVKRVKVGYSIQGDGIPVGTTIERVLADRTIQISNAATATGVQDLTIITGSFTGKTIRFTAKKDLKELDATAAISKSTLSGIAIDSSTQATITIQPSDTGSKEIDGEELVLDADIQMASADGTQVYTLASGKVTIEADVSRISP